MLFPHRSLDELHLSPNVKEAGQMILRFEKSRSRVYGTWAGWALQRDTPKKEQTIPHAVPSQQCCLCAIAGPTGHGKRTFVRSVCYDLGRPLKMVHASSALSGGNTGSMHVCTL